MQEMRQLTDARIIPVTQVGDVVLLGFRQAEYEAALAKASSPTR